MKEKDLGTFKFLSRAIKAVGVNESDKKFINGYQYQYYRNKTSPTTAFYLRLPSLVVKEIVAFLPAAFMIP